MPPCIAEMPFLAELRRQEEGGALKILAINTNGDTHDVRKFLSEYLPALEILFDKDSYAMYKLQGVLTDAFIDRNGNIRFRLVGFADSTTEKDIELITQDLLAAVPLPRKNS